MVPEKKTTALSASMRNSIHCAGQSVLPSRKGTWVGRMVLGGVAPVAREMSLARRSTSVSVWTLPRTRSMITSQGAL